MANVEASLETRVTGGGVGTPQVEGGVGRSGAWPLSLQLSHYVLLVYLVSMPCTQCPHCIGRVAENNAPSTRQKAWLLFYGDGMAFEKVCSQLHLTESTCRQYIGSVSSDIARKAIQKWGGGGFRGNAYGRDFEVVLEGGGLFEGRHVAARY